MSYLEAILIGSKAVFYQDHIVLLVGCEKGEVFTNVDFGPMISYMQEYRLYGGISRCFKNITDFKHYYLQALKTLELGMLLNKNRIFYSFDEYAIYHLINRCSLVENPEEFCHPAIM